MSAVATRGRSSRSNATKNELPASCWLMAECAIHRGSSTLCASLLLGALREVHSNLAYFSVPEHLQAYLIARLVVSERRDQVARAADLLRSYGGHDVAAVYSGGVGRTAGLDLLDQSPRVYGTSEFAGGLRG